MTNIPISKIEALLEVHRSVHCVAFRHMRHSLKLNGQLSMAAIPILKALYHSGPASQHQIAEELHHSDAAISRQVGILAEKGWVQVKMQAGNRRVSVVELTPDGRAMIDQIKREVAGHFADILASLPAEEVENMIACAKRLEKLLNEQCEKEKNE